VKLPVTSTALLTACELAQRLDMHVIKTKQVLDDLEADGLVERVHGRYRLTVEAERRHGRALRDLRLP
jgi:DNA-binding IclR family transcriptional regulator